MSRPITMQDVHNEMRRRAPRRFQRVFGWKSFGGVAWQRTALVAGCTWRIEFDEFDMSYHVSLFNLDGSTKHPAFDELDHAKNYCAAAEQTH